MADPSLSPGHRIARGLAVAIAIGVAGCGFGSASGQGDPAAPLLVRGKVVDAAGVPIGGARLQVEVRDMERSQVGQPIPLVFQATYTANADGTFAIHLPPTSAIAAKAATNGGYVTFHVTVISPDQAVAFPFGFERRVGASGWLDEAPELRAGPTGIGGSGAGPLLPVPQPAAS